MATKVERLISLIFATSRLIRERTRSLKRIDPFTFLQIETLRYVQEKGTPSMKELADYLCVTPPSATSLINPLIKTKMLERAVDKNDRRAVRLSITSKGRKNLNEGFNKINSRMRKILIKISAKEQESLIKILEKLSKVYTQ